MLVFCLGLQIRFSVTESRSLLNSGPASPLPSYARSLSLFLPTFSAGLPFSLKILQGSSTKKKEHICDNSFSINVLEFIDFMDEDYQLEICVS